MKENTSIIAILKILLGIFIVDAVISLFGVLLNIIFGIQIKFFESDLYWVLATKIMFFTFGLYQIISGVSIFRGKKGTVLAGSVIKNIEGKGAQVFSILLILIGLFIIYIGISS